ncbi:protein kinase [Pelomyxa schiedti]|nr:protein kinase [Pelomyxa schiedti]
MAGCPPLHEPPRPSIQCIISEASSRERRQLASNKAQLEEIIAQAEQGTAVFHIEIDPGQLVIGPVIGKGSSGVVLRGTYQGKEVAIKKYGQENLVWNPKEFRKQIALMSVVDHPNLLTCIGACTADPNNLYVISELLPYSVFSLVEQEPLPESERIRICYEIASGMNHLHSVGIIHRDLKSGNILLTKDFRVRIIDFDTCKFLSKSGPMTFQIGTPVYMAPELFSHENYSEKVDVFSFAIVMWEIFSHSEPYKGDNPYTIPGAVLSGQRPPILPEFPAAIKVLLNSCWQQNPEDRPSFSAILSSLSEIIPTPAEVENHPDQSSSPSADNFFVVLNGRLINYRYTANGSVPLHEVWGTPLNSIPKPHIACDLESQSLFVATDGEIRAIQFDSGLCKWSTRHQQSGCSYSMCIHSRYLIVGGDGTVTCLNKHDGTSVWYTILPLKAKFSRLVQTIVHSGIVYAGGLGNVVLCELKTGSIMHTISLETSLSLAVCLSYIENQSELMLFASTVGKLCSIRCCSGTNPVLSNMTSFSSHCIVTQVAHPTESVLFIGIPRSTFKVRAIMKSSLATMWQAACEELSSTVISLAISPRVPSTLFAAGGGCIYSLDTQTGNTKGLLRLPVMFTNVHLMPLATLSPLLFVGAAGGWFIVDAARMCTVHYVITSPASTVTAATPFWSMCPHASGSLLHLKLKLFS